MEDTAWAASPTLMTTYGRVCGGRGARALTTSTASRGWVDVESKEVRWPQVGLLEATFFCATPTPKRYLHVSVVMRETWLVPVRTKR